MTTKVYVVYGNHRSDDLEGQVFGVFYDRAKAEDKAIEVAVESFEHYHTHPWHRHCSYQEELNKTGYVFLIEGNDPYETFISVNEIEFVNTSKVDRPSKVTILWGTLDNQDGAEYYPLDKAFSSKLNASLYLVQRGTDSLNFFQIDRDNREVLWDRKGYINYIMDKEDYIVYLAAKTWNVETQEEED